jgi:hypothetical protein
LHTDARAAFLGSRLNAMLDRAFDFIASSEDEGAASLRGGVKITEKWGNRPVGEAQGPMNTGLHRFDRPS